MYRIAVKTKRNVKREFETLERAINYALYLEKKFDDNIFILNEDGKDITAEIEF